MTKWFRLGRAQFTSTIVAPALVVFGMFALTGALEHTAHAGPTTELVKAKHAASFDLLKQATVDADKKFGAVEDDLFDYTAMAEASLGSEWTLRSEAEKAQITDLIKPMVRKFYERTLKKLLAYNVEYVAEESAAGAMIVRTHAKPKADSGQAAFELNYKLVAKAGIWKCRDVVAEGGSLTARYRSEFTRLVKKSGFTALVQKMQEKLAKGDI